MMRLDHSFMVLNFQAIICLIKNETCKLKAERLPFKK
jgi:hypothetical protein